MAKYYRLAEVGKFRVTKDFGYKWKMWNETENRWVESQTYLQGFKKKYNLGVVAGLGMHESEEQGYLEVSSAQMGNMLEATLRDGKADIIGKTFEVRTNGESGRDIRYYINLDKGAAQSPREQHVQHTSQMQGGSHPMATVPQPQHQTATAPHPVATPSGYAEQVQRDFAPIPPEPQGVVGTGANGEVRVEDIPF